MGFPEGMTAELLSSIESAELIIGAERIVKQFHAPGRRVVFEYRPLPIRKLIEEAVETEILILVTGDQGFYSAAGKIAQQIADYSPRLLPGISSVACFSSRIGIPYSDAHLLSAHGRSVNLAAMVRRNPVTYVLAGGNLVSLLETLRYFGFSELEVYTGEDLSCPEERIRHGTVEQLLLQAEQEPFSMLSLMAVLNPRAEESVLFGIPDEEFIRGSVPMTKREVRSFILSSMRLKAGSVVVDIGAGTGSVSVEAALSAYKGIVYAIERKKEAQDLIEANAVKFHADNIRIIVGEAPEALTGLPAADVYYIGGSGGRLGEILERIRKSVDSGIDRGTDQTAGSEKSTRRIVLSASTLQTLSNAQELLERMQFVNITFTQIQASRSHRIGSYDLIRAENPVFVITADF